MIKQTYEVLKNCLFAGSSLAIDPGNIGVEPMMSFISAGAARSSKFLTDIRQFGRLPGGRLNFVYLVLVTLFVCVLPGPEMSEASNLQCAESLENAESIDSGDYLADFPQGYRITSELAEVLLKSPHRDEYLKLRQAVIFFEGIERPFLEDLNELASDLVYLELVKLPR
jgi:hypothetical protein